MGHCKMSPVLSNVAYTSCSICERSESCCCFKNTHTSKWERVLCIEMKLFCPCCTAAYRWAVSVGRPWREALNCLEVSPGVESLEIFWCSVNTVIIWLLSVLKQGEWYWKTIGGVGKLVLEDEQKCLWWLLHRKIAILKWLNKKKKILFFVWCGRVFSIWQDNWPLGLSKPRGGFVKQLGK